MEWDKMSELGEEPVAQPKASDSSKDGGEGKGKDKDPVADLAKQVEQLTKRTAELQAENEFWQRRLGGQQQAAQEGEDEEPEDEPEDEPASDDEPIMDALSTKGVKALVSRGLLTKKAAEKMFVKIAREEVKKATDKIKADAELFEIAPELKDLKSEVAQLTAKYFQEAIREDPNARKSHAALRLAAKAAKAEVAAKQASARREEDGESRRRRIAVQDAGGDGWGNDNLDDDAPTPLQLSLAGKLGFSAEEAGDILTKERKRR